MAILGVGASPLDLPDVASQLFGGLPEVAASSARRRCPPLGWRFGVARSGGLKLTTSDNAREDHPRRPHHQFGGGVVARSGDLM